MENIFENFAITILKLNKLVQKLKNYEMQEYGLKTIHVMCGYYLKTHSEGLTASELSKLTLEDKAAISRAVDAGSYSFTEEERLSFYKALGSIAENLEKYYDGLVKLFLH